MEGYGASTYGDSFAQIYDESEALSAETEPAVEGLAALAGGGPALELAIGTGRIALPLAARGLEVHGIDVSEAMVAKLREKPGGTDIAVTIGDFADVPVDGRYPLIFLVFNTFFALTTQEAQIRCFENVAAHLAGGGVFVIEAFVPDLSRLDRGQRVEALGVGMDRATFELSKHDAVEQRIDISRVMLEGGRARVLPLSLRYAWPSEIDLMARLAGLRLRERWGGWDRGPFGADSGKHISLYERAG